MTPGAFLDEFTGGDKSGGRDDGVLETVGGEIDTGQEIGGGVVFDIEVKLFDELENHFA